jgi:hypothetical protein
MSAATFTLHQIYARVAFIQTGSAWGKERQQSCARPASNEIKRNLFAFFEPDRASEGIFSKPIGLETGNQYVPVFNSTNAFGIASFTKASGWKK